MLKNSKISTKLAFGFGIVGFLLILITILSLINLNKIDESINKIVHDRYPKTEMAHNIIGQLNIIARSLRNMVIMTNEDQVHKEAERVEHANKILNEEIEKLQKVIKSDRGHELIRAILDARASYQAVEKEVFKLALGGKKKEASEALISKMRPVQLAFMNKVEELVKYQGELMDKAGQEADDVYKSSRKLLLFMGILAIALAVGFGFWITRSITKPINRVAAGLSEGSEQVASASAQVSSASQSLAEGASEQAAGIQETSSSIEEMASMTKKNAESANQANNLMMQTSQVVDEANQAMKELINSMNEISTTSEETAKIIKTIDEIAFQTNLLALNAAVEAARAGEAGAGFAVVADEVRNLAMRAAEAAKNTASLIEESVKKIKNGSQIVSKTNEAFEKVAVSSKKVAELMAEIAAASQEQSQGIEQINKAVAEMDKVVQKNAASAEESASAAEEMNAQAETMKGFVEELMALVGKRDGNGWIGTKETVGQRFEVKKIGGNGGKHLEKVVSKIGGLTKKDNGKFSKKEAVPKQVIPLEEGDFKEF